MRGRWRPAPLAAMCAAVCVWMLPGRAAALGEEGVERSAEDLAAARSLFANALRDEEGGRMAEALFKFLGVRAVKDTAAVEYRIGTCYEALGQAPQAYTAYRQATLLGQDDPRSDDVVTAARERLPVLAKRLAFLELDLHEGAPPSTQIRVDGAIVARGSLREPLVLEPGSHVITADAGGAPPSRNQVDLPAGSHASLSILLRSEPPPPPASDSVVRPPPPPPPADSTARTAGWISIAAGGALATACAVLLVVRAADISKLDSACPGGACPASANRDDLQATHDRALVEGPLALALGIAGAVGLGAGAYLLWSASPARPTPTPSGQVRVLPWLASTALGVGIGGTFR